MLMRVMRIGVAAVTVVTTMIFLVVFITSNITKDRTIPYITVEDGVYDVSVNATDEDLKKGVTAFDGKDGDISDQILIESISKFSEIGYCKVTYAVSDSDNHVTTATRQIHYVDYTHAKFKVTDSLVFSVYDTWSIIGKIGAVDCLDGDISQNVIIYSPDYIEGETGTFSLKASVSNSKGDDTSIILPISIEKLSKSAPVITLKEYLIYIKKGQIPDWKSYIAETVDSTGVESELSIKTITNFKPNTTGMFTVNYYGTDSRGQVGHTFLAVMVEE